MTLNEGERRHHCQSPKKCYISTTDEQNWIPKYALDWVGFSIGYGVVRLELESNCLHEENIAKGIMDPRH